MAGAVSVGWTLRADVPDGIFTLAIEADDETAAAEHAAFADRALPLLTRADSFADPERLRSSVIDQLSSLRRAVAGSGVGYLGAVAGQDGERVSLVLLSVAGTQATYPPGIDPAPALAAKMREQYPEADVEEFETPTGSAVGLRRLELMSGLPEGHEVAAGVAQAVVPFPDAGLLGTVTGYSYAARDIDTAAVLAAVTACRMRAVGPEEGRAGNHLPASYRD
jgi:hypothetical protein